MNEKIAVLLGGISSEREISIKSGYAVLKSLLRSGLNAYPIDTRDYSIAQLKRDQFNQAYIMLHGKGGEDGSIQGVLQYLNIPYTGSGIMASSISIDKYRTKLIWKSSGLETIPDIFIEKKNIDYSRSNIVNQILNLGFPVLIKPNNQGSSIGITLVSCVAQIDNAINTASIYDNDILIEKFITGKEYTVSILNEKILPSIHIAAQNSFYDYNAKYISSSTEYFCPSGLSITQEKELQKKAMLAWNALGCSGCGRIDMILDNNNKFWLLEVNTIPGMTKKSLVPIAAQKAGISFDELVLLILNKN